LVAVKITEALEYYQVFYTYENEPFITTHRFRH